jgi:hypothetical protein
MNKSFDFPTKIPYRFSCFFFKTTLHVFCNHYTGRVFITNFMRLHGTITQKAVFLLILNNTVIPQIHCS